jgi:AraC-like DNA-binding protein
MKLYVKYMVSLRCKMVVRDELENLGLQNAEVDLGMITLKNPLAQGQREQLKAALLKSGLELMDDKKAILIERVKNMILEMVFYEDELPVVNFSDYLSEKLDYDYTYLANTFSQVKGITIEQYIIANKIERAKELLIYSDLNLTEISYKLNYSSVAHLSSQFKKVTGLTPSFYKQLQKQRNRLKMCEV